MAAQHQVYALPGPGYPQGAVRRRLEGQSGNIHALKRQVLAQAQVGQDYYGVGLLLLYLGQPFGGFGGFVAEVQVAHIGGHGGGGRMLAEQAQHGYLFALFFDDSVRFQVNRVHLRTFIIHVGAQHRESRAGDQRLQAGFAVIVVVVAGDGGGVAQLVHEDHAGYAFRQDAFGRTLGQVAGIEEYIGVLLFFEQGGQRREAAYDAGGVLIVPQGRPRGIPAVRVGGMVHDYGGRPGGETGESEEQRQQRKCSFYIHIIKYIP